MGYTKIFDPQPLFKDLRTAAERRVPASGDRRDGKVYVYTEPLVLAVNVALATGRPLLLRGPPGSGKSSAAYNIARILGRRYYEKVITSRMTANDLLWRYDAVRRLGDAQVAAAAKSRRRKAAPRRWESYHPYIQPEVMWWVFDRASAERRGLPADEKLFFEPAVDPAVYTPPRKPDAPAVVLLDEIDKAEPDVPNNLLVTMGSMEFQVDELQCTVKLQHAENLPLLIVTTNEERQLPSAFLRRCVVHRFPAPTREELIALATKVEPRSSAAFHERIAAAMERLADERRKSTREEFTPSVAEFLDAVRACQRLGSNKIDVQTIDDIVERATWKTPHEKRPANA
ncbi:MAG TPA: MoxR family ATPase [Burkholderiales bacterium]|nr:MoxR family ATPase [Burkholderiales bacterium]